MKDERPIMPKCVVCLKPKTPMGRDAAAASAGSYCDWDCEGYLQEPLPSSLWPGEDKIWEEYDFNIVTAAITAKAGELRLTENPDFDIYCESDGKCEDAYCFGMDDGEIFFARHLLSLMKGEEMKGMKIEEGHENEK